MRKLALAAITALTACTPTQNSAPPTRTVSLGNELPAMQSFAVQTPTASVRSNYEIAQDFLDLSFRLESGRIVPVLTRFEGPITVRIQGAANQQMVTDLRNLLHRLRTEAGLDIFLTGAETASITIEAVPSAELTRAVPHAACFVVPRITSWTQFKESRRTPMVDWTTLERRDRAAIFIPAETAPQETRDCLHEELAQALGPLNDLYRLPDSVFNDDNMHAVLTSFDMLILRAYYDRDLQNGMSRGAVAARLPAILARLNPQGQREAAPRNDTSRDWIESIEIALTSSNSAIRRRAAAERAVNLAYAYGWSGTRLGFSHFVYGRLMVGYDPALAHAAFEAAAREYNRDPAATAQRAHVAVQLASYSLARGDYFHTLTLADQAIPIAARYENATLLATLMMFKAEALEHLGRDEEAQAIRLDSMAWARYGFGSERDVRARMREVASLDPN